MTLSIERMRYLLRKGLGGLDDNDLPTEDADELLNLALWEISNNFGFEEKENVSTGLLTAGTRTFVLPSTLEAVISVAVKNDVDQWGKLERMSSARNDEVETEDTTAQALPEFYFRRNDRLVFEPTPDADYSIRITQWQTVESLLAGCGTTTGLPRNWDELVVEGAVVRGHFYGQDYNLAQQATSLQVGKLRSTVETVGKEEKYDSRYARLRVIDELPPEYDERVDSGPLYST